MLSPQLLAELRWCVVQGVLLGDADWAALLGKVDPSGSGTVSQLRVMDALGFKPKHPNQDNLTRPFDVSGTGVGVAVTTCVRPRVCGCVCVWQCILCEYVWFSFVCSCAGSPSPRRAHSTGPAGTPRSSGRASDSAVADCGAGQRRPSFCDPVGVLHWDGGYSEAFSKSAFASTMYSQRQREAEEREARRGRKRLPPGGLTFGMTRTVQGTNGTLGGRVVGASPLVASAVPPFPPPSHPLLPPPCVW